ncbi:transglutaminase-like cysteine peptidase [Pseudomonas chlororaphis]|uniref:transglutaminase-like cysteine peptidase n=1 Tax=Pseudomonas chlororaphis TaxID=587753 RepID=UPI002366DB6F|nr:transglutaminase-like cysteine peptidase [Pseudomonas chlororaphis]WDG54701.1 transglutaminase-like cysteine peptidase [Pseudomonas chlororaphis]WDH90097.1 transglutaminase-like cysteine peptidase [Pseudomonas chlororaphis]
MPARSRRPEWTLLRFRLAGWSLLLVCLWTDPGNVRANWEFVSALSTFEYRHQVLGPARERLKAWNQLLQDLTGRPEYEQLNAINRFFNQQLSFKEDQRTWQQGDYWATPIEALLKGAGDCEDYALAKYFSLRSLGVSSDKLRLTYVKARRSNRPHMVLAYYPSPGAGPLILDNLSSDIRSAAQRQDPNPVYAFNAEGLYLPGVAGDTRSIDPKKLSRWQDVLKKMRDEGFTVGNG